MMSRYRDLHLRVLKLLEDNRVYGHAWTTKQITCCLTECREELRYNLEAIDCLIRNHLVNLLQVIVKSVSVCVGLRFEKGYVLACAWRKIVGRTDRIENSD